MKDVDLYTIGGMSSSSPAMFERRRRILNEARRLIGQGHPEGFNIRELCVKARVAPNTLYNAFGSKENVIALAVLQYFEEFHQTIGFEHEPETFDGMVEREMATSVRNLSIPHYVRAVTALYFSASSHSALRQALVSIGGRPYLPWLAALRISRKLETGVDLNRVAANLSAMLYAQVHEWRIGELDDDALIATRMDAVLCYLAGIVKGSARGAVRSLYADLRGDQERVSALLAKARIQTDGVAIRSRL